MTDNSTLGSAVVASSSALIQTTLNELRTAAGNPDALAAVITQFFQAAVALGIDIEEIENILGVNEPSIMDLAELSEEDEEVVITIFEHLSSDESR